MAQSLSKISKFLSLVLRHRPEAAGITLDEAGWADVKELLDGVCRTGRHLDTALLETIVAEDEKQRYSFNSDHTRIRANQGHSIPVQVDLEQKIPPDTLYHGTATRFLASIREKGLLPMGRLYVHLSRDADTAYTVGRRHGTPVVLSIDTASMARYGHLFFRSANGVWLTKRVPPEYLTELPAFSSASSDCSALSHLPDPSEE